MSIFRKRILLATEGSEEAELALLMEDSVSSPYLSERGQIASFDESLIW